MFGVAVPALLVEPENLSTLLSLINKKTQRKAGFSIYGGEGGIRTLEAFRLTHFPGVLLRPLGHLTSKLFSFAGTVKSASKKVRVLYTTP